MKGCLVYIVGASGSGKDTLLNGVRKSGGLAGEVIVAHRYITRPNKPGAESHVELGHDDFEVRQKHGLFSLSWSAHGNHYGIGCEIDSWMESGFDVLVNGSRKYLSEVEKKYPDVLVIKIAVDSSILKQRLIARGRETSEEIERRVARNHELDSQSQESCLSVDNSGSLADALESLTEMIATHLHA